MEWERGSFQTREECLDAVKGPGKFENEPIYTPYFFNIGVEYGSDLTLYDPYVYKTIEVFKVTKEDRKLFPELKGVYAVVTYHDDYGFVYSIPFKHIEFDAYIKGIEDYEAPEDYEIF